MKFRIGVIYDKLQVQISDTEEEKCAYEQEIQTKEIISKILKGRYDVIEIEANREIIQTLIKSKIDLAFPLCTGIRGESRQSQIPAILEMLQIPYIGSGILGHALALNKSAAKQIFDYNHILTPSFQIFYTSKEKLNSNLRFPLIVKPSCEGSGFGIHKDNVVYNEDELILKIDNLLSEYRPPVLVEEFIEGRELTVGVIGNGNKKRILPIMEIDFDNIPKEFGNFYTFEVKSKLSDKTKYICPASISLKTRKIIEKNVNKAFDVLGCKDIARVDIRLKGDKPFVLEINSLPGLKPIYSDLPKMASKAGMSYEDLIFEIVETAIERITIGKIRKKIS